MTITFSNTKTEIYNTIIMLIANSAQTEYCSIDKLDHQDNLDPSETLKAYPSTPCDAVGLPLNPLGPCRPTPRPPGTL